MQFDSLCKAQDVFSEISYNSDFTLINITVEFHGADKLKTVGPYKYIDPTSKFYKFIRSIPKFKGPPLFDFNSSYDNYSPIKFFSNEDTTSVVLLLDDIKFSEPQADITMECDDENYSFLPDYSTGSFKLEKESENIYRYIINNQPSRNSTIRLSYSKTPIQQKSTLISDSVSTLPKSEKPDQSKPLLEREGFWLFIFAFLGAIVSAMEIYKRVSKKKSSP